MQAAFCTAPSLPCGLPMLLKTSEHSQALSHPCLAARDRLSCRQLTMDPPPCCAQRLPVEPQSECSPLLNACASMSLVPHIAMLSHHLHPSTQTQELQHVLLIILCDSCQREGHNTWPSGHDVTAGPCGTQLPAPEPAAGHPKQGQLLHSIPTKHPGPGNLLPSG